MKTITIHVSDETAKALQAFHAAHSAVLAKVTECRDALVAVHPESCIVDNCPTRRQIALYDKEIDIADSLQRLHHDLLESLQFAQAEAE